MRTQLIAAAVGAAWLVGAAAAQCPEPQWRSMASVPGVHGRVHCAVEWDPDGVGPRETVLVVGGEFNSAGDVLVRNLAVWDGTSWTAEVTGFQNGFATGGRFSALVVREGRLFAATRDLLDENGMPGPAVLEWNGTAWVSVGGIEGACTHLIEYSGGFAAAGQLRLPGGIETDVAVWDGAAWGAIATLQESGGYQGWVYSLHADGADLLMAGRFGGVNGVAMHHLARYSDGSWLDLSLPEAGTCYGATSLNGEVVAAYGPSPYNSPAQIYRSGAGGWDVSPTPTEFMARPVVLQGDLYLVTLPYNSGGWGGPVPLWKWAGGAWQPVGAGIAGGVRDLALFRGGVIALGDISFASGRAAEGLARLESGAWMPLGTGITGNGASAVVWRGQLCVSSISDQSQAAAYGVHRWTGTEWARLPIQGDMTSLVVWGDDLVGMAEHQIVRFDGVSTEQIGTLSGWYPRPYVFEGVLYCHTMSHVYRFDPPGWTALGEVAGNPEALAWHDGSLYASGSLEVQDYTHHGVARWDGSVWVPVGARPAQVFHFVPKGLASFNGDLYAWGEFHVNQPWSLHGIAKLVGDQWTILSDPEHYPMQYMRVVGRHLVAVDGPGFDADYSVRAFNGSRWRTLAQLNSGPAHIGNMGGVVELEGELVLFGDFSRVDGTAARMIAAARIDPCCGSADFDGDGSPGTDADIEAFFACLAGRCCEGCGADFDDDGDTGTDADIEAFFRVLAGGVC